MNSPGQTGCYTKNLTKDNLVDSFKPGPRQILDDENLIRTPAIQQEGAQCSCKQAPDCWLRNQCQHGHVCREAVNYAAHGGLKTLRAGLDHQDVSDLPRQNPTVAVTKEEAQGITTSTRPAEIRGQCAPNRFVAHVSRKTTIRTHRQFAEAIARTGKQYQRISKCQSTVGV